MRSAIGSRIPLRELADIRIVEGPAQISREHASRRIAVEFNVVGRDLVGAVEEAQARLSSEVRLPSGYYVTWGGQFENQQRAMKRLTLVVPLVLGVIFLLLFVTFGSLRQAGLILLTIPFAMIWRPAESVPQWALSLRASLRGIYCVIRSRCLKWSCTHLVYQSSPYGRPAS